MSSSVDQALDALEERIIYLETVCEIPETSSQAKLPIVDAVLKLDAHAQPILSQYPQIAKTVQTISSKHLWSTIEGNHDDISYDTKAEIVLARASELQEAIQSVKLLAEANAKLEVPAVDGLLGDHRQDLVQQTEELADLFDSATIRSILAARVWLEKIYEQNAEKAELDRSHRRDQINAQANE